MRIRLEDTPDVVELYAAELRNCFDVVEESSDYPNRGTSQKVRRYLDIRIRPILPPIVPDVDPVTGRDYAEEAWQRREAELEQAAEAAAEALEACSDLPYPDHGGDEAPLGCWGRREDGEPCAKVDGHGGACEYLGEWRF